MFAHKWFLIAIAVFTSLTLGCRATSGADSAAMAKGKPSAPVSVQIEPDSKELAPGEIVDFRITAASPVAIPQLELSVDVPDDLAVFSGDRTWQGPLPAGGQQELVLAIRMPEQAGARITATAVARFENGQVMAARDVYVLGAEAQQESTEGRDTSRNGQPIREYQLP